MRPAKPCDGCSQAHNCSAVYQQLGHVGGPSVVWKVIVAFALPIIAFIAALAGFERLLAGVVAQEHRTLPAFGLALAFTVGLMLIASFLLRRGTKGR